MKKQKKQKLLNVWNKIKKPLVILSFVGNIIFLLFIIVGCVGVKKNSTQVKADNTEVITLRGTSWSFDVVPTRTPNGTFMNDRQLPSEVYTLLYQFNGIDKTYASIEFRGGDRYNSYGGNYFNELGGQTYEVFAYYDKQLSKYHWNDDRLKNIIISSVQASNNDSENLSLIEWFSLYSEPVDYVETRFEFISQINYNGYFGQALDSMFINANNEGSKVVNIDLPFFRSNGEVFNRITLYYLNGGSMAYLSDNGTTATNTNTQTWYFSLMYYENTLLGTSVAVNYRKFSVSSSTYLIKGSTWKANSYRYLVFQGELTPEQRESLECFNNDSFSGFSQVNENVGLGNVFNILGQAFVSLRGILSIELLPNISIGLLVFMPLIVGIILTIIWLVKR